MYRGRYAVLDRIAFALSALVYTFLSARTIPKEEYGILMIALSIGNFLNLACEAGVGSAMVKYGAEERSNFGEVFFSAVALKLLFAACLSIILVALSRNIAVLLHDQRLLTPIRLLPVLAFATALNNSLRQGMQARQEVKKMFLMDTVALGVVILLYGSLALTGRLKSASGVIAIACCGGFSAVLFGAVAWLARLKLKVGIEKKTVFKLLNFGKYSTLSELGTILYSRIDTVMIGFFLTGLAAATYNAAWVLSYGVNLLMSAISLLALPVASIAHSRGSKGDLREIYETTTAVALTCTIPLFLVLVTFAHPIIRILYSNRYPDAVVVLRILAIWWLIKPFGTMAGNIFYGAGRPRTLAIITLGTVVLNVIANLVLIPRYGIAGAAWASIISFSVGILIGYYLMRKWLGVSMMGIAARLGRIPRHV
jgi:O-antigen/teichoic acid export membrane protein